MLLGIGVAVLIFVADFLLEYAVSYTIEGYCYRQADKIPVDRRWNKMEPTEEQKQSGFAYVTRYYQAVWACEDSMRIPTPSFSF